MNMLKCLSLDILQSSGKITLELFKVMIPLTILIKILDALGWIKVLATALTPLMGLVGLPGSMGFVWASGLATNLYGGIAAFAALAPSETLTVAQATVISSMLLIAHGLPIELMIARKAGPSLWAMGLLRVGGALLYAAILNGTYTAFGFHPSLNRIFLSPPSADPSLSAWALNEALNLVKIFIIILALVVLLRVMKALKITDVFAFCFKPFLSPLGIGPEAMPMVLAGMTLGISYGGGLIIDEARSGRVPRMDIFFALALMGLCHSVIEDTLLMMALGAHLSGIFFGRLVFTFAVVFLLKLAVRKVPDAAFDRFLSKPLTHS